MVEEFLQSLRQKTNPSKLTTPRLYIEILYHRGRIVREDLSHHVQMLKKANLLSKLKYLGLTSTDAEPKDCFTAKKVTYLMCPSLTREEFDVCRGLYSPCMSWCLPDEKINNKNTKDYAELLDKGDRSQEEINESFWSFGPDGYGRSKGLKHGNYKIFTSKWIKERLDLLNLNDE